MAYVPGRINGGDGTKNKLRLDNTFLPARNESVILEVRGCVCG